jgi:GNAT superfamily N-acetyltransferase
LTGAVVIRAVERSDVGLLFALINELATYERAPEKVIGTPELLESALFGPRPSAEAVIAELDGTAVGFALFYGTFSTWQCLPGIWLEDLYVSPAHRRSGVGAVLLAWVARAAVERGCGRLEWAALDWNDPALSFYDRLGAERLDEWMLHRLEGEALAHVAERAADPGGSTDGVAGSGGSPERVAGSGGSPERVAGSGGSPERVAGSGGSPERVAGSER